MNKFVLSFILVNLLVACASEKPKVDETKPTPPAVITPSVEPSSATQSTIEPSAAGTSGLSTPAIEASDPLNDPNSILAKRSVHYVLDSYAVEDADKPVVQAHARYLSEHPDRKVRVEGNADERGSNEYNLALGQRRADSVKKMLMLGGAKEGQIEASSFGEEKPIAIGHDEASWAQNRRTDLIY